MIRKGIKAKKQVGCSGYKIDLAVVDREKPGEFILGIECDGAAYHSSKTARDRDRLRQQVLEQLGWDIYRIWSTDWFKNPKQELEEVLDVIKKAQEGGLKKKVLTKIEHKIEYSHPSERPSTSSKQVIPYVITPSTRRFKSDSHDFYNYVTTKEIAKKLELVVNAEGPIYKDEAIRRVAQFWGFSSTGSRIKERLQEAVSSLKRSKNIKVKGDFYWPKDMEIPQIRDRENAEGINKKITAICPEEIGEAALFVLSKEYGIPESDLIVQTAKVLGYKRVTEDMSGYIAKSINKYKSAGYIIKKGDKLLFNQEKTYEKKQEQPKEPESIDKPEATEKPKEKPKGGITFGKQKEQAKPKTKLINICPKCNKTYDDTWKVCLQCDGPLEQKNVAEEEPAGIVFGKKEPNIKKVIQEAIDKKRTITIEYSSPTKGESKRTIAPFKLEGMYVRAYCHLVNANRTFRVDRITKVE